MPNKYLKDYASYITTTTWIDNITCPTWEVIEEKAENMPTKRRKKKTRRPTRRPKSLRPLSEVENISKKIEEFGAVKIPDSLRRGEHLDYLQRLFRRPIDGQMVNSLKIKMLLGLGAPSKICKIEELFGKNPEIPVKIECDALLTDDMEIIGKYTAYLLQYGPSRPPRAQFVIINAQTLQYLTCSTVFLFGHKMTQLPADVRKWDTDIRSRWLKQRSQSTHGRTNSRGFRLLDSTPSQLVKLRTVNLNPSRKQLRQELAASQAKTKQTNELPLDILDQ